MSLQPKHLGRYRDIARLLIRYGRSDLVRDLDIDGLDADDRDARLCEDAQQLATDLEKLGRTFTPRTGHTPAAGERLQVRR